MNRKLTYRVIFVVCVAISLLCNGLPFISVSEFGFSVQISALQLFDAKWFEVLLDLIGNSDMKTAFSFIKIAVIGIILLDLIAAIVIWAKSKLWAIIGIIASLIDFAFYGIMAIVCYSAINEIGDFGFSVGLGIWGHIIAGLAMNIVAILYCCSGDGITKEYDTKDDKQGVPEQCEGSLVGLQGEYAGIRIPIGYEPVFLGRDAGVSNLVFSDRRISGKHCSIEYDAGRNIYIVRDFSTNGTFKSNGVRLPKDCVQELRSGEEVRIGEDEVFCLQ